MSLCAVDMKSDHNHLPNLDYYPLLPKSTASIHPKTSYRTHKKSSLSYCGVIWTDPRLGCC
jgi:hypothetical protein